MSFWKKIRTSSFLLPIDVLLGKLGLFAAQVHPSASLFWPVIGFDLTMLFLYGYWVLPIIFTGSFIYNLLTFGTLTTCFFIALGNTLKVFIAYKVFNRPKIGGHIWRFIVSCVPAAIFGATIGTISLLLDPGKIIDWSSIGIYATILQQWSLGDSGGLLLAVVWFNWMLGDFIGLLLGTPFFTYVFKKLKVVK